MRTIHYFLGIFFIGLMVQCSSGKKAFEKGDYYSAVIKSVNRLRQNPDHKKSKETLKAAYPMALSQLEMDAARILSSTDQFKHCEALERYEMVNQLHDDIRRCPGALRVIPNPKSAHSKTNELKQYAADERYKAGIAALERGTRASAKDAYYHFLDAKEYVSNFRDVDDKIAQARYEATLRVLVEKIPVPAMYSLSNDFFQEQLQQYLNGNYGGNPFVEFYNWDEARNMDENMFDHYLQMEFENFVIGQTFLSKDTETFSRDSVVVGTVTLEDGTSVDAYNTVSAQLTSWKKETLSNGVMALRIFDVRNDRMLNSRRFDGNYLWVSQWGSFNGDERALDDDQLVLCNQSEVNPPPPQQLFVEFTKSIYDQLTRELSSFYNRY